MTADEIREAFSNIEAAVGEATRADATALQKLAAVSATALGEQLLVDVHRIADALEVIAGTRTPSGQPVSRQPVTR